MASPSTTSTTSAPTSPNHDLGLIFRSARQSDSQRFRHLYLTAAADDRHGPIGYLIEPGEVQFHWLDQVEDEVESCDGLVELDASIRMLAQTVKPATVRSLGAIHLATALRVRPQLTSFITYDKRLADTAQTAGPTVDMPT
jgi:hypothetical protein